MEIKTDTKTQVKIKDHSTEAQNTIDLFSLQEKFKKDTLKTRVHIIGNLLFCYRVKKAIKILPAQIRESFDIIFPAKHIISSERLKLDSELGILYLNHLLQPLQIAEIFQQLIIQNNINPEYYKKYESFPILSSSIGKMHRRLFRDSIENRMDAGTIKIIKTPPRGKVATEDQHFLMTIMQLKMYISFIAAKIEKHSDIALMVEERKHFQKILKKSYKENLGVLNPEDFAGIRKVIEEMDKSILNKRLILQGRFIGRVITAINKWLQPERKTHRINIYKEKLEKTSMQLYIVEEKKKRITIRQVTAVTKFFLKIYDSQIITIRRKQIKYNYLLHVQDNQRNYSRKLGSYLIDNYHNALIPSSYVKSSKVVCFDFLRFTINAVFIGLYVYIIKIPLIFMPIFSALGLFVFQPIANKFAVLFMSAFVRNNGIRRLPASELKRIMDERTFNTKSRQYLCAIDLPIFTGKEVELETVLHYIKRNISNLRNTLNYYEKLGIIYQITSNTADEALVDKEVNIIKKIQSETDRIYGPKRIYFIYLHRNSGVAKKVGNILAAHMFKYRGMTSSAIYRNPEKFFTTIDEGPIFDRVFGNISDSLCAKSSQTFPEKYSNKQLGEMILQGENIPVEGNIDFTFFVDNKNEIKPASLEKALAIMLHPENSNIVILQPQMSIEDPVSEGQNVTSAFLRMTRIARDIHNVRYLNTLHSLYHNMSAYYGKGMIRIKNYDYMVINEVLNLKYVDSHDWQESVFNHAVLAISGDEKVSIENINENTLNMLIEKKEESFVYNLHFEKNICTITDENGSRRELLLQNGTREEQIQQVHNFAGNGVEVGERDLISTIGNYNRDVRWLRGDLQMFNTFLPYANSMPPYHKLHLENIFRRLTGELALFFWVLINFLFSILFPSGAQAGQELLFILTLYFAVTAFGFAGIDLFIYPIFFEIDSKIHDKSQSFLLIFWQMVKKVVKKIINGLWQLPIYLLIAWPRVLLGISSSIRIHLSGIDHSVNWGNMSNAGISAEETSEKGIPLKKFFRFYLGCMIAGIILLGIMAALILNGNVFSSILMPLNMGLIITSLIFGPFVSYVISKKIKIK